MINDQNDNIYISKHNIKYISFHNMNNCLCFFNTSLHLMKTSQTLTNMLNNDKIYNIAINEFPILMTSLCYYVRNFDKITIEKAIKYSSQHIIYNGYVVEWLLNKYYFPIIYYLSNYDNNIMLKIWKEMSIEKHLLKKTDKLSLFNNQQTTTQKFIEIQQYYNDNLTKLLNIYNDNDLSYECVIMEIYPNINNQDAHVVAVVDGEYILDREKCCSFEKYINEEINNFYKFRFDYINSSFVKHIKYLTLETKLYSYVYINKQNKLNLFIGGGPNDNHIKNLRIDDIKIMTINKFWLFISLVIQILILISVICVIYWFVVKIDDKNKLMIEIKQHIKRYNDRN